MKFKHAPICCHHIRDSQSSIKARTRSFLNSLPKCERQQYSSMSSVLFLKSEQSWLNLDSRDPKSMKQLLVQGRLCENIYSYSMTTPSRKPRTGLGADGETLDFREGFSYLKKVRYWRLAKQGRVKSDRRRRCWQWLKEALDLVDFLFNFMAGV